MKLEIRNNWLEDVFFYIKNEGVAYTDNKGNNLVINSTVKIEKVGGDAITFKNGTSELYITNISKFIIVKFYSEGVYFEDKDNNMFMIYTKQGEVVEDKFRYMGCID